MTMKKDIADVILVWTGVATSFITLFLPLLQFVAVILAITVSIRTLTRKPNGKN